MVWHSLELRHRYDNKETIMFFHKEIKIENINYNNKVCFLWQSYKKKGMSVYDITANRTV